MYALTYNFLPQENNSHRYGPFAAQTSRVRVVISPSETARERTAFTWDCSISAELSARQTQNNLHELLSRSTKDDTARTT